VLDGRRVGFIEYPYDDRFLERCRLQEIHPPGPLHGCGETMTAGEARALDQTVLHSFDRWRWGLEALGLEQESRTLQVKMDSLGWQFDGDDVRTLTFMLPAGAFATALLREMMDVSSLGAASSS
jgi:tRNA pseudouridine13 synthase